MAEKNKIFCKKTIDIFEKMMYNISDNLWLS